MRVLVTGGAGFIGANLCRTLLATCAVEVIVLDDLSTGSLDNLDGCDVEVRVGSVLDADAVGRACTGVQAIVHLAALGSVPRSVADPTTSFAVNATGTVNVLEAARRAGTHVLFASSSSVYGSNPALPKHEDLAPRPMSPYAASKLATESTALAYSSSYALPVLAFRFFNVYGPLQRAGHAYAAAIPAFVHAALRGEPVTVFGDGSQSRDFTFVDTVCEVLTDAVIRRVTSAEPVNLAFGSRIRLNDIIDRLSQVLDSSLNVRYAAPRVGDVLHSSADGTRVRALFPAVRPVALDVGLAATVEWMRRQIG
ncbi:MAG: NAD-dependent epimerase/dehydratase family protein [Ilumatobacteraceae bacterium]